MLMKESAEKVVQVGFRRSPKKIFDEVEMTSAAMLRQGWSLKDAVIEESLGNIHLIFEREAAALSRNEAADRTSCAHEKEEVV